MAPFTESIAQGLAGGMIVYQALLMECEQHGLLHTVVVVLCCLGDVCSGSSSMEQLQAMSKRKPKFIY